MQALTRLFIFGTLLFGFTAFAQDSVRTNNSEGSKVRNIDGVAVVVNTGYVTRKEIDDRIAVIQKQGGKLPDADVLRKSVTERIIIEKIQLQEAQMEGITVSDKELDRIIAELAAKNKISVAEFRAKVVAAGSTYERYKQMLRDDVVMARFREREVESKIKISDAEIDNYIAEGMRSRASVGTSRSASTGNSSGVEEIDVAQIYVPVDSNAGVGEQADAKKKAEAIYKEARGDIDFMQLGALVNKENPKIKFQELGYRTPDRLPQLFYEAVKNIGGGQLAISVIKSPAGYHVLKVLDRRTPMPSNAEAPAPVPEQQGQNTPQNITITQTMARHILLRNRPGLVDADAERRLQGYRDQVRAKTADFAELAKKYSEDGSAENGGLLGWMSPGDLVPEFEQAMNRLQIGEISNPVKSEFGWHLIQVVDRRDAQLTIEKQREFARAAIRERKFDQAYQDWIRQLRDGATVKVINMDDAAPATR